MRIGRQRKEKRIGAAQAKERGEKHGREDTGKENPRSWKKASSYRDFQAAGHKTRGERSQELKKRTRRVVVVEFV